jgi:hypothetical protein
MTSEIRKDSKHTDLFPPPLGGFTQDEKDRLAMLVRKEIVEVEQLRLKHELIITTNKTKQKLIDEQKQQERDYIIGQHIKVVEMFTKELERLETLLKKLDNND